MFIISLPDASAQPRTVMVQSLNTDSASIAVAGPRRTIDVAGHAELNSIDFLRLGHDIGYLNMALDLLVLRYE